MPETLAYFRLIWHRDRKFVAAVTAAAVAGIVLSLIADQSLPTAKLSFMPKASLRDLAVVSSMLLTLVPAIITVFALFNFQIQGEQLETEASCCSHWLLRLPIKSWKIAIVPIVLKTMWISICWFLITIPLQLLTSTETIPWLEPSISLSAIAIGALAITWRPFRSGWRRIGAIVIGALFSMYLFALPVNRDSIDDRKWDWLIATGIMLVYGAAVWFLIDSIRLARHHVTGLIPVTPRFALQGFFRDQGMATPINHGSAVRALGWHEIYRARKLTMVVLFAFLLPVMILVLFIGLHGATVFIAMMMSACAAWSVLAGSMYPLNQKSGTVLPLYLVASPIPSHRIAWTRLISSLIIMTPFLLFTIFLFAVCALWESNRTEWFGWVDQWAKSFGKEDATAWMGLRLSVAVLIGSAIAMYGRILSYSWVSMSGRDWLAGIAFSLTGAVVLAAVMIPISWFFRLENLDEVKATAMWWLSMIPRIMAGLLCLKAVFAFIAGWILRNRSIASNLAISRVLVIWGGTVVLLGWLMHVLIPDPRAGWVLCLASTAIMVPLGSILWMPISVDSDRHR